MLHSFPHKILLKFYLEDFPILLLFNFLISNFLTEENFPFLLNHLWFSVKNLMITENFHFTIWPYCPCLKHDSENVNHVITIHDNIIRDDTLFVIRIRRLLSVARRDLMFSSMVIVSVSTLLVGAVQWGCTDSCEVIGPSHQLDVLILTVDFREFFFFFDCKNKSVVAWVIWINDVCKKNENFAF